MSHTIDSLRSYKTWQKNMTTEITDDKLWSMDVYRRALFASDLAWHDILKIRRTYGTRDLADQLYRAVGSVSANIAEGYSRSSGKDRKRFYEYALGSARESRDWYYKCGFVLGDIVTDHRIRWHTETIKQLLTVIPMQKDFYLKESPSIYVVEEPPVPFVEDE